jgi:hypothetical protein
MARTIAEIPAIKAVKGIKNSIARGRIAAVRQKWLGMELQVRALKTPQTANINDPRRIRASAAATRIRASGTLKLGGKL